MWTEILRFLAGAGIIVGGIVVFPFTGWVVDRIFKLDCEDNLEHVFYGIVTLFLIAVLGVFCIGAYHLGKYFF